VLDAASQTGEAAASSHFGIGYTVLFDIPGGMVRSVRVGFSRRSPKVSRCVLFHSYLCRLIKTQNGFRPMAHSPKLSYRDILNGISHSKYFFSGSP
jgi:hypothetical protein